MATTTIKVIAKGHRPRRLTLVYAGHNGTTTSDYPSRDNVDHDLYRIVETGQVIEIPTPAGDCTMFPGVLRVRSSEAHLYGLQPRARG